LEISSKVVGKWGHMDFFAPTENHILVDFDMKKIPISKLSFLGK
jgi:hypothetical protein